LLRPVLSYGTERRNFLFFERMAIRIFYDKKEKVGKGEEDIIINFINYTMILRLWKLLRWLD
jgi:hypothetical protein